MCRPNTCYWLPALKTWTSILQNIPQEDWQDLCEQSSRFFFFFKQVLTITQQHRGHGLSIRAAEIAGIKISHFSSFKSVSGAFPTIYSDSTGMHEAVGKTTESWCIWEDWELAFPSDLLLHPAQSMARDPNRSLRMNTLNKDGAVTRGRGMETLYLFCHCYKESNPEFGKEINSIEVN